VPEALSLLPIPAHDSLIEAILQGSRDAVMALRPVRANGKIVDALCEPLNTAAVAAFYVEEEALVGESLSKVVRGDVWSGLQSVLAQLEVSAHPVQFASRLGRPANAQEFACVLFAIADGRLLLIADGTKTSHDDAQALQEIHHSILNALRHGLRTPLNTIIGFAELIEGEHLGPLGVPQYREYMADIADAGHSMLDQLERLFAQEHFEALVANGQTDSKLIDLAPDLIAVLENGKIRRVNAVGASILGVWGSETLLDRSFIDFVVEEDRGLIGSGLGHAVAAETSVSVRLWKTDGTQTSVELRACRLATEGQPNEQAEAILVVARDVTARNKSHKEIATREMRLRTILDTAIDGIMTVDEDGTIEHANPAADRMFGFASNQMVGLPATALLAASNSADFKGTQSRRLKAFSRRFDGGIGEVMCRHRSGRPFPAELSIAEAYIEGRSLFIGTVRDITDRKDAELRMRELATRDSLTRLPNRISMEARLDELVSHGGNHPGPFAILFVDLDNFSTLNEAFGHEFGDAVLIAVARRIERIAGADELIAHLGGDEFVVLAGAAADTKSAQAVADLIHTRLAQPLTVDGREIFVTASIGVVLFPDHGRTRAELWRHVHSATSQAKLGGRNKTEVFSDDLSTAAKRRVDVEAALRRALERDEFDLHFQPKIDLFTHKIVGAEALVRWTTPTLGRIGPDEFIPLAERSGMIMPLGEWIIYKACELAANWPTVSDGPLHVGVNLSAVQFAHGDLVGWIQRSVNETGLDPTRLDLELTETMLASDPSDTVRTLRLLKDLGAKVAMDDFGTGYSSLSYLTQFPLDSLKVDRSFVTSVPEDPGAVTLARAIVGMGKSLGLKIVAEGVETRGQMTFLQDLGCDVGQGYLFSKPVSNDDFVALVRRQMDGALMDGNES